MIDHDQIFKIVLRACLRDFFRAFLPEWEPRFDFDAADWLDKEVFENPPQGKRRFADLVVKLPLRMHPGGAWTTMLCLIHIEIESEASREEMRRRMLAYYPALRDRHPDIPVLPIAIYMNSSSTARAPTCTRKRCSAERFCGSSSTASRSKDWTREIILISLYLSPPRWRR